MRNHIAIVLLVLLSVSFAGDACSKQTGIITTSFHVYNALIQKELIGDAAPLNRYIGKTVYLTYIDYDTIVVGIPHSTIFGVHR